MAPDVPKQPPGFFWQGLLIVLPAILLAGAGFYSLRQDRVLAEHEAARQAEQIAIALARRIDPVKSPWPTGVWSSRGVSFPRPELDPVFQFEKRSGGGFSFLLTGTETWPPAAVSLPLPAPLDGGVLSPHQQELWAWVEETYHREGAESSAIEALLEFLESGVEGRFEAVTRYRLGNSLAKMGRVTEAWQVLEALVQTLGAGPGVKAETGVSLRTHALLGLLELAVEGGAAPGIKEDLLHELCGEVVSRPTPLTVNVLDRAGDIARQLTPWDSRIDGAETDEEVSAAINTVEQWRAVHQAHGKAWELIRRLRKVLDEAGETDPREVLPRWLERPDAGDLFLSSVENAGGVWIVGEPMTTVRDRMAGEVAEQVMPEYFGVSVSVAGREVLNAGEGLKVLATAGGGEAPGGGSLIDLSVVLAQPDLLFARQRVRTLWFGSLIGLSVGAVLIGFGTAYRAFRRQRALSEMKSNFVSSVSHELRAPIASVRLMAEELEEIAPASGNGKAEKVGQYHRFIVQECRRLSHLIDNVLDYSRIEQGRKQFEFEPADIGALVRETASLMEPYASERGVRLVTRAAPEVEMVVEVDEASMRQVLVNLMDNAIKHSPAGEEVTVTLGRGRWPGFGTNLSGAVGKGKESVEAGTGLWICVADAGEGIPPEDQERIFERFYRRGSELRRETRGVGLGLAIARHVVQAHGGNIEVESSPGAGSRFIVRLPVLMEPDVSGAEGGEREEKARGESDSEAAISEKG
ncbi:MAG TPA: ATP-binding protein [Methylomirabilota bacterium]|nr:ATP-binding protein [Methylomirabilota bacterium]